MNAPTDPQLEERLQRYDRWIAEGRMSYNADACYGCGLWVTVCPIEATTMNKRVQ